MSEKKFEKAFMVAKVFLCHAKKFENLDLF